MIGGNLKMLSRRGAAGELEVEFKLQAVLPLPTPPPGCPEELLAGRVMCDVLLFFWPRQFLNSWSTVVCISLRNF